MLSCENSVNYLTAWQCEINLADLAGNTPLHLAVLSGNARNVHKLLTKGADCNARVNILNFLKMIFLLNINLSK